tara:strand:- start:704 stop:958 length:255 start_codon:yes stop_codon:yes gene_type:complete
MRRTIMDYKRLNPHAGKIYAEPHPTDKNQYRTVYMRVAPTPTDFIINPSYTNYVTGTIPSDMELLPPRLVSSIMRTRHLSMSPF